LRLHPARALVRSLAAIAQTCQGVPTFWLGGLLLALFSIALGWLPPGGIVAFDLPAFGAPDYQAALLAHPANVLGDLLAHLLLPACTLALAGLATPLRLIGAVLPRERHAHHAQVARGMGLSRRRLLWRSARPALPPVIGGLAGDLPILAGALVLVEYLFGWPGLGLLALHAARAGDGTTLEALALLTGLVIIVAGLIADLTAAWADPRLRMQAEA
jgi:peptide/nickel transport system permease protein